MQALGEIPTDLGAVHDLLFQRGLNRQARDAAHFLEDGIRGRKQRLERLRRLHLQRVLRLCESLGRSAQLRTGRILGSY